MLGTRYGLAGTRFSDSRDSMIILSDYRDPNRVTEAPSKTCCKCRYN